MEGNFNMFDIPVITDDVEDFWLSNMFEFNSFFIVHNKVILLNVLNNQMFEEYMDFENLFEFYEGQESALINIYTCYVPKKVLFDKEIKRKN